MASDVQDIQPEPRLQHDPPTLPAHNTRAPSDPRRQRRGHLSGNTATLELQRSASAEAVTSSSKTVTPQLPPCITAYKLDSEQIKKNYSSDNVWDRSMSKLPPVSRTQGFGKYTTAVDADPSWRARHLSRRVMNLGPNLGTPMNIADLCGIDQDEWDQVQQELRRYNTSSSTSADSASSRTSSTSIDPQSGARIVRGFAPAPLSSPVSLSPRKDVFTDLPRTPSTGRPFVHTRLKSYGAIHGSSVLDQNRSDVTLQRRSSTPLDCIEELQMCHIHGKKVEQPCQFSQDDDTDSAIASETSDDDEWADVSPMRRVCKISAITRMLNEQRGADAEYDLQRVRTNSSSASKMSDSSTRRGLIRSRTVRSLKSATRRMSRTKLGATEKHNSINTARTLTEAKFKLNEAKEDIISQDERGTRGPSSPHAETNSRLHQRHRSATVIHCKLPVEPVLDEDPESAA